MIGVPKVFISYSWDNEEHKKWILSLAATLRDNGVDASMDVFETQKGTTHLTEMMVKNIRDNDYTIIVMTTGYAKKADSMEGGVGTETRLLQNVINSNANKVIPILRNPLNSSKCIPFYLDGYHYIDFSEDKEFNNNIENLLYRIFGKEKIELPPIGNRPNLESKKILDDQQMGTSIFNQQPDDIIPNLRKITDRDKVNFMKESFTSINKGLNHLFEKTKAKNSNFDYDAEDVTTKKYIYKIYLNGNQKFEFKIWLGNIFGGTETINMYYGPLYQDNDNAFNESIGCIVDENRTLKLKTSMNMTRMNEQLDAQQVVEEIWKVIVQNLNN